LHHSPSYHSELLIKFIEKLDMRVETTIKRSTSRILQRLELLMAILVPKFAKSWTVRQFDEDNV